MADPKKYSCEVCNHTNFLISKFEVVNGKGVLTTDCYYCESKFCLEKDGLHLLSRGTYYHIIEEKLENSPLSSNYHLIKYIVIALVFIGAFCFIINVANRKNDSSIIQQPTSANASSTNYVITTLQNEKCDFTAVRTTAISKLKVYGLSLIEDKFQPNLDYDKCEVTYYLYVKKIKYDQQGKSYLEDKTYQCNLTYRRIVKDFEYINGLLIDLRTDRAQNIP